MAGESKDHCCVPASISTEKYHIFCHPPISSLMIQIWKKKEIRIESSAQWWIFVVMKYTMKMNRIKQSVEDLLLCWKTKPLFNKCKRAYLLFGLKHTII